MKQAIGYIRVSTTQQGKSGLGLEAQRAAIAKFTKEEGIELLAEFQEVETGYCTWLGGCADADHPLLQEPTRTEHMADSALEETLLYALDLEGFRSYLNIPAKRYSDEKLLALLHKSRASSNHIPPAARAESEQWLTEHDQVKESVGRQAASRP